MFNSFIFPSIFTDAKVKLVCVMGRMHQNPNNLILCPPDTSKEEIIFRLWLDQLFFQYLNHAFLLGVSKKRTFYCIYPLVISRYKNKKEKISNLYKAVFRNKFFSIIIYSWIEIMGIGGQYCPWGGLA